MTGDPAVVREALVDDDQLARALGQLVVVHREEAADRHEVVLLRREDRAVAQVRDRPDDLGQRPVRPARLAVLDEDGVLGDPRRVEDERHAVLVRQLADVGEVLDRERLPAGHVDAGLLADVGDPVAAVAAKHLLERVEVDVPLEREVRARGRSPRARRRRPRSASELDVRARGREVEVRGHELTWRDEQPGEQVLRAASLVRRDHVPVAVDLANRRSSRKKLREPA